MKHFKSIIILISMISLIFLFSCKKENGNLENLKANIKVVHITKTDYSFKSTSNLSSGVMMQAFYWDVPAGGTWWDVVQTKVKGWSKVGINAIWLPPATKAQNGPNSMGYDPYDYFDFGNYNQMGSVETRFGSKSELKSLITASHNNGLSVIADIVINHNSGGSSQYNPFTQSNTWTDFHPLSGKFNRSYWDFYPNNYGTNDEGSFGGFPDLCHKTPYVQDWLWKKPYSVAQYYKNEMGFDGWRFDYVKGYAPWVVKNWVSTVGGFSVGEYWDSNATTLDWWANEANSSVFDFACYYRMNDAFDGNNLNALTGEMMWKRDPFKAVTFVTNHDTDEIWNKMLAYSYILTHEGYPCIFYRDYEEWLDKNALDNLIWIHNHLAGGSTDQLYVDNDEYIARRNGYNNNGLIIYINNSNSWLERWVPTNWYSKQIKDYTGHSSWEPYTQSGSWVKIQCPPKSYTIWSTK